MVKNTTLAKIPEGWGVVRLGNAVEINKESRDPTRDIPDGKFLYIDIESVEGETGIIKTAKQILGKDAPSRARRVVHKNDVIMSTVRPYLKAFALVPNKYDNQICSTGFAVLSCRNEILSSYLLYTLFSKNVIEQCNKMMMGGQYPALNQSQVAKIKILLPPLPEQRRIAEVLSTVDSAIQKVGGAIEKTERLKRGLMQRLLTRGIRHERFKDTKMGRIPQEWNFHKIENLVPEKKGVIKIGPFGSQLKKDEMVPSGMKVYGQENVMKNDFAIGNKYITEEKFWKLKSVEIFPDDILVTMMGSIGYSSVFPRNEKRGIMDSHLMRIQVDKSKCLPIYLSRLINDADIIKSQILSMSQGAIMSGLNSQIVKMIRIPLPPLSEQRRIAEILSAVDRKLELEHRRKEKLERVKKGLMNQLLTGKKRIKVD